MAKGFLDLLFESIFGDPHDPERIGRYGEKLTERKLNLVRFFGRDGKILRNVYIPKNNGETSEIDVLFITEKGIFVIESKNYSGWIFGDEKSTYWTAMLANRTKNRFYNPIKQNRTHIKWLGRFLNEKIHMFSLIVFSERCELKKITVEGQDFRVIKRDRLYANIRDIWDDTPDSLTDVQITAIYSKLKPLTNADSATKAAHIEQIQKKFSLEATLCPWCGGTLVLRTAKKGTNAGNQFYGCSNYPKCRFTKTPGA